MIAKEIIKEVSSHLEEILSLRRKKTQKQDGSFVTEGDIKCQEHHSRPIDGHRHRHLIEGQTVEQHLHVAQGIDSHATHADLTQRAR